MAGTDRWLTYLNTLALFGMITALAFFNLDFPIPAFLQKHLKVVDKESPIGGSMPHNLADEYRKGCPNHQFTSIMHVSRSPPIMLIEGFLTEAEADFLVKLAYLSSKEANC
jgi:hypothetical protein